MTERRVQVALFGSYEEATEACRLLEDAGIEGDVERRVPIGDEWVGQGPDLEGYVLFVAAADAARARALLGREEADEDDEGEGVDAEA